MAETVPFEKALERLEKIVQDLESGDLKLEEALKKYEEGVKLARLCQSKLDQAEKKVEILTRSLDGTLKKEPFDYEEGEEESSGKGPAAKKSAKQTEASQDSEKDLLL